MPRQHNLQVETTLKLNQVEFDPLQKIYYDDVSQSELAALRKDLRDNGQRDPIHVYPIRSKKGQEKYALLDGEKRKICLEANGETEVRAIIHQDLADADEATIESEFLKFNYLRRQLHPLDKAKIALRLFEIERNREPGELRHWEEQEGQAGWARRWG